MGWKKILTKDNQPFYMSCDEGPYEGVIFYFETVSIRNTMMGNVKVKFTYKIKEDLQGLTDFKSVKEKQAFERFIADALLQAVIDTAEENENRNNNLEEPSEP